MQNRYIKTRNITSKWVTRSLIWASMLITTAPALAQSDSVNPEPAPLEQSPAITNRTWSQRTWINVGFYSAHFDRQQGLRDANPGIGIEYTLNPDWSLTAGRFINSDNKTSHYAGAYWQPLRFVGAKWGVVMGAFNGYPKTFNGAWFPAVIPVATWEYGQIGLNVALVPPIKNRLYGAISLQLKMRLGR